MRKFGFTTLSLIFMAILCSMPCEPTRAAGLTYIDISNPFLRKIPIAIPYFKPLGEGAAERDASKKAADLYVAFPLESTEGP